MAIWYVKRNETVSGPFDSKQLKLLAVSGQVKSDDLIRRDDRDSWHKASYVRGLFPIATEQSSDAAPIIKDWYYTKDGKAFGPISFTDLSRKYTTGEIKKDEYAAQSGMNWIRTGILLEPEVIKSATDKDEWFIFRNEQIIGPKSFSQLRSMLADNQLLQADLIGRNGSKGVPVSDLLFLRKETLLERIRRIPEHERRFLAGGVGAITFVPIYLLLGGSVIVFVALGFFSGYISEAYGESSEKWDGRRLPKMSTNPLLFFIFAFVIAITRIPQSLPSTQSSAVSNDYKGQKFTAFRKLVNVYSNAPRQNVTVDALRQYQKSLYDAQQRFAEIPFDPKKQRREAKAIADLYMKEMHGIYSGQLADDLYRVHITPILEAVIDEVVIPDGFQAR